LERKPCLGDNIKMDVRYAIDVGVNRTVLSQDPRLTYDGLVLCTVTTCSSSNQFPDENRLCQIVPEIWSRQPSASS
jgi:hypothetical protein